ncbi:MAG: 4-(cytidine 5'-diphospho)-2-C-methyl-D-erythritol kinase [Pseudolabrys sp.]
MPALLTELARAKVNLTLRVTGRRPDGYHTLESLVAFADFGDRVSLEPREGLQLLVSGEFAAGVTADNLVFKAETSLATQMPGLRAGRFALEKNIPVAAGLGGGSADAAAALRLLARLNGIALDDPRLLTAARAVGADVPVCLDPRAKIMRGIGEELSASLDLPKLDAVLVNPGVALATRDVFAAFDQNYSSATPPGGVPPQRDALLRWLLDSGNDLTKAAISRAPAVGEVLAALEALAECKLARMSGSGATCFGLFVSASQAEAATALLRGAHTKWWIRRTALF